MITAQQLNEWIGVPVEDLADRARVPFTLAESPLDVHRIFANDLRDEIEGARAAGREISLIVPLCPVGQFPILARRVNEARLLLDHVSFFGMDDWLDWQGRPFPRSHPFSLESRFHRSFIDLIEPDLQPRPEDIIFPTPLALDRASEELARRGNLAASFGGVGFQGHLAFNEPPASRWTAVTADDLRNSLTRVVPVAIDTIIAHAQRSAGGNVFAVPPMAICFSRSPSAGSSRIRLPSGRSSGLMKSSTSWRGTWYSRIRKPGKSCALERAKRSSSGPAPGTTPSIGRHARRACLSSSPRRLPRAPPALTRSCVPCSSAAATGTTPSWGIRFPERPIGGFPGAWPSSGKASTGGSLTGCAPQSSPGSLRARPISQWPEARSGDTAGAGGSLTVAMPVAMCCPAPWCCAPATARTGDGMSSPRETGSSSRKDRGTRYATARRKTPSTSRARHRHTARSNVRRRERGPHRPTRR